MTSAPVRPLAGWLTRDDCDLDDFRAVVEVETDAADYPHADRVDVACCSTARRSRDDVATAAGRRAVQAELAHALHGRARHRRLHAARSTRRSSTGASTVITSLIAEQKARGVQTGDHFAKPGATTGCGARWRSSPSPTRRLRRLLRQRRRHPRSAVAWLGPELPDRLRPQRGQPRRHGPDRAPRLPPRLHGPRPAAQFPAHVHRAVAGADAAGRRRARRHAGRDRTDDVPAALAEVRARLPGHRTARVPGVLRRALRAAAAGEGRRGVLQPRPAARRRHQPHHRRQTDGEPAAGLVGVRPGAGARSTPSGSRRRSTRRCAPARRPAHPRRTCTTSSPRPRRATPSRRTWTATRRSAR